MGFFYFVTIDNNGLIFLIFGLTLSNKKESCLKNESHAIIFVSFPTFDRPTHF